MATDVCFSAYDFDEIGAYLGQGNGCDSLNEHYYTTAAFALDFYKVALGAVKGSAVYADSCAFFYVHLFGAQIGDVFVAGIGYGNELLHLAIRDDDWDILAAAGTGAVLQEIDTLFQVPDCLFCGVDEDEVVYGGEHLPSLCAIASFNESLLHWYKTLDALAVEELLCNEFAAVGGAHSKPHGAVLILHGVQMSVGVMLLPVEHSFGSSMVV